uniref:Maestro/Maestro-like HEAT-repeats domain-containing protein n=1 Tax=Rousettus aegyptiacus TaxID=9407 RepID=A0A7J8C391_ROUAE|nr:hypothetical protein HJG63_013517 [Rousettus aegyptiacus]
MGPKWIQFLTWYKNGPWSLRPRRAAATAGTLSSRRRGKLVTPGSLLSRQLPPFLDGFFRSSEPVVVRLMGTVSDTLHRLGAHGLGAQSLSIAINSRSFFEDERDGIRAAAVALFGDLVAAMAGREPRSLRTQVQQSLVPLLLHLEDRCPAVATQAKFTYYRCAELLGWQLRHTLFCSLAWARGLSARHFLWACLTSCSQEELGIHFAQALSCLHSCQRRIKTRAALFIGYTLCYHPRAASQAVNDSDKMLLLRAFEDLKKGPEPGIREFATRQLSLLQEVAADRSGLQPSSLTGQTPSAPPVATAWSAPPRPHRARWHNIFPFERKI